MIIYNFNITGILSVPGKTYAPLVVYTDAPLSFTITFELLKSVAGRNPQILKICGSVEQHQFA